MFYKILEKYTKKKSIYLIQEEKREIDVLGKQEDIIREFLDLKDSQVKVIHNNQEKIEENLKVLYAESTRLNNISKESMIEYDEFVEYLKEAGDLYNWSQMLRNEIEKLHNKVSRLKNNNNNE